ncbi:MAG: alpha/beta hydrolase-fold protein [Bacillus subtilis]|nr:alpha/beta hydrolase-fold protein [Bacillus subtilis]
MEKTKTIRVFQSDALLSTHRASAVLYMHDGQNLFDPKTASYGASWEIPSALDDLYRTNEYKRCLSSESTPKRPTDGTSIRPLSCGTFAKTVRSSPREFVGGRADRYIAFLVNTLKPFIDRHYSTIADESYLAGSSMGGIVSLAGGVWYPTIYRKIGVFSPAYWFHQEALENWLLNYRDVALDIYQDIGTNETSNSTILDFPSRYVSGARRVADLLRRFPKVRLEFRVIEGGIHNERDWAKRFLDFLLWLTI